MISTKQKARSIKGRFIFPLLSSIVLAYFGYHIYYGVYGLRSRPEVEAHIAGLKKELALLIKQRVQLEKNINLLKDGTIEKDTLDEYARGALNLSKKNEWTILLTHGDLSG